MTLLDVTLNYLKAGFCPIPITPRDKKPLVKWTALKFALPSVADLHSWFEFRDELNVALVTGHNGLTVIDFDTLDIYREWLAWASAEIPHIARATQRVFTSRGMHLYVHLQELPATGPLLDAQGQRVGIDIKARGGYVLAPPSIHPSGAHYRAGNGWVLSACRLSDVLPPGLLIPAQPTTEPTAPVARNWDSSPWSLADHADERAVEKVKQAWRIEQLLGELFQTGGHHYVTRCPLHDDGNPSMWVDLEKQICGCFAGCTPKPLDVINLYARMHGLSNTEAILSMVKEA
jgi:hypothetical protein